MPQNTYFYRLYERRTKDHGNFKQIVTQRVSKFLTLGLDGRN
jgi:hypothetical protein